MMLKNKFFDLKSLRLKLVSLKPTLIAWLRFMIFSLSKIFRQFSHRIILLVPTIQIHAFLLF